jgi:hypothetical protein
MLAAMSLRRKLFSILRNLLRIPVNAPITIEGITIDISDFCNTLRLLPVDIYSFIRGKSLSSDCDE